jgi:hypothetical protein
MTMKDKTGDRLVASIRRTRAGIDKSAEASAPAEAAPPLPAAPPKAKAPAKKRAAKRTGGAPGNYQSRGRVWPD